MNNDVITLFDNFTSSVENCLAHALEAIAEYIDAGDNDSVKNLFELTHEEESLADKYRRDIIDRLIKGAFMRDKQKELMMLVEDIDNVADGAEELLDSIIFIGSDLPFLQKTDINKMAEVLTVQFSTLKEAVRLLFKSRFQAVQKAAALQKFEADLDIIEEEVIRRANRESKNLALKLLCYKTVKGIADLGDIMENAGDDIAVIASMKRG